MKTIINVIKFIIINELQFRGHESSVGIFNNLLQYTSTVNNNFKEISTRVSKNATYTSPSFYIYIYIYIYIYTGSRTRDQANKLANKISLIIIFTSDLI